MSKFLVLALVVLVALIANGRMSRSAPPPGPRAVVVRSAPARVPPVAPPAAPVEAQAPGTPTIDLLARLEGRRRLSRAVRQTYFDSLFLETDSVVRRWPDRGRTLVAVVRRAAATWEAAGQGLRFTITADTTGAQIAVRSIDQLAGERAGQTDLQWTRDGAIHSALITLARRDHTGRPIPAPGVLAVAVHEIGHAMGLAHSPLPDDVMYPVTRTSRVSQRDRSTITLLYELPLGTIREVITP
jgi:hypothetical protein